MEGVCEVGLRLRPSRVLSCLEARTVGRSQPSFARAQGRELCCGSFAELSWFQELAGELVSFVLCLLVVFSGWAAPGGGLLALSHILLFAFWSVCVPPGSAVLRVLSVARQPVRSGHFLDLTPDLGNQRLWVWGPAICDFRILPGNSGRRGHFENC